MTTVNVKEARRAIIAMAKSDKSMKDFAERMGLEKANPNYFFAVREALSDLSHGRCGFAAAAKKLNAFH